MFAPPSPVRKSRRETSDPFIPNKVVVLSQLGERERESYLALILRSNASIHVDATSGKYVANLRIHGSPPPTNADVAPAAAAAAGTTAAGASSNKWPPATKKNTAAASVSTATSAPSIGDRATVDLAARLQRLTSPASPTARKVTVKVAITAKTPAMDRARFSRFWVLIADDGDIIRYSRSARHARPGMRLTFTCMCLCVAGPGSVSSRGS